MKWAKRLMAGWLAWKLFGPELTPRFSPGQRHPLRLPGRSIFVGDTEFFLRESGAEDRPPLVLVHGWGDHSLAVYSRIIPILGEQFRVIAIDNRNSGMSERIRGKFEIATMADELAAIIEQLDVGPVSVFGYSMGGMITQELANRHPHLVRHVMLGSTAAYIGSPNGIPIPALQVLELIARAGERISRGEVSALRTKYLQSVDAIEDQHARWYWTQSINRDPELYWQAGFAVARFDSREWVGRLDIPALLIITCVDQLMPPKAQYDLASRLKDVTIVELHDARHEAPLTHAKRFSQEIADFMSEKQTSGEEEQ